jgi:hypothetical protein
MRRSNSKPARAPPTWRALTMANKFNKISGQFAARLIEMMESPAYRVLSLSAHRALSRIEIEFAHHGGQDNGKLPVTFDNFADYGIHRASIGPALAELEALGFIKITEHGKMTRAAEYRRPNKFLLTSRPAAKAIEPLNSWRRFKTVEEALAAAEAARQTFGKKEKAASTENVPMASTDSVPDRPIASTESEPLHSAESVPLSILRVGTPSFSATGEEPATARPRLAWTRPVIRESIRLAA